MKKVYIAGPLFDDHERKYLEEISDILEKYSYDTFLPHRDAGLVKGEFTLEIKKRIYDTDMKNLKSADIVVALADSCRTARCNARPGTRPCPPRQG